MTDPRISDGERRISDVDVPIESATFADVATFEDALEDATIEGFERDGGKVGELEGED